MGGEVETLSVVSRTRYFLGFLHFWKNRSITFSIINSGPDLDWIKPYLLASNMEHINSGPEYPESDMEFGFKPDFSVVFPWITFSATNSGPEHSEPDVDSVVFGFTPKFSLLCPSLTNARS